jgi:hypothetical protein
MDPDKINLENLSKSFEYYKAASEIDSIDCTDTLRNIAKSYIKLYFKQQEVISSFASSIEPFGFDEV